MRHKIGILLLVPSLFFIQLGSTRAEPKDPAHLVVNADIKNYRFNPNNRDPFLPFLKGQRDSTNTPPQVARTPLQKYEINQYSLTGIIFDDDSSRNRALVEDPEGIGYVIEVGDYIGKNWGKVERIVEGVVVVTEEYQTADGNLVVERYELRL